MGQNVQEFRTFIIARENPCSMEQAARTAAAAVLSLLGARVLGLPEGYWAAISTLIVMQSSLAAALPIPVQRFAGTAVGAVVGGLTASCFPGSAAAFGAVVLLLGMLCAVFSVDRTAYRQASITLVIITLVPRTGSEWVVAALRFLEVSIGITAGLVVTALWPEHRAEPAKQSWP